MRVEFKTEPAKDANTLRGKFFRAETAAGENWQKIQFENEQLRITRLVCAAGQACAFALNAQEPSLPSLLVALAAVQFKPARGKALKLISGQTRWLTAGKREPWVNAGKEAAEWLRFEFKTAPLKTSAIEKPHEHPHDNADAAKQAEASALLKRGAALESAGKLDDAIAAHEQALALNPQLVQAHINLIALYGRKREPAKAEKHYHAAAAINPDLPDIHYNFGILLTGQERFSAAAQAFRECLRLDPYAAEAHFNYAALIEREGQLDEAAAHYRQALKHKIGYRSAHFSLGRILVNQDRLAEALEQLQKAVTPEDPQDEDAPRFLYALGATYARAGDKPNALVRLREALKRATALRQTQLAASIERDLERLEKP